MNWTFNPVEPPERSKSVPRINKKWERLEAVLYENFQFLLQDYVNGSINPVARVMVGWVLKRSTAAKRYVGAMRQLKDAAGEQQLYQPNPVVLQRIRSRIERQPLPARISSPEWATRIVQVVLAILILVIIWQTSG